MEMAQQDKNTWKHPDDEPLKSSRNDFKTFESGSLIWADMKMVIEDRIEILTDDLIYSDNIERIKELRIEIRTLKQMLGLPNYITECLEREKPRE